MSKEPNYRMSKETTLSGNYPVETMVETWKPPCLVVSMVVSRGSFLAVCPLGLGPLHSQLLKNGILSIPSDR